MDPHLKDPVSLSIHDPSGSHIYVTEISFDCSINDYTNTVKYEGWSLRTLKVD